MYLGIRDAVFERMRHKGVLSKNSSVIVILDELDYLDILPCHSRLPASLL